MKIDNEANFRKLWMALAKADYKNVVLDEHAERFYYKVDLSMNLGVFNDKISSCRSMAACPACYEAFKRAKVSMSKTFDRRLPCSKCPLDWHMDNCEEEGTLYHRWSNAKTVKTARKYAKLISEMKWK